MGKNMKYTAIIIAIVFCFSLEIVLKDQFDLKYMNHLPKAFNDYSNVLTKYINDEFVQNLPSYLSNNQLKTLMYIIPNYLNITSPNNSQSNITTIQIKVHNNITTPNAITSCHCVTQSNGVQLLKETLVLKVPMQNVTTLDNLKARHPNLPVEFITKTPRCQLLPSPMGIKWVNDIWQLHAGPSGHQMYLYSAFFDNRIKNEVRPSVAVLAMTSEPYPDVGWCHLWMDASKPPLVAKVIKTEYADWQGRKSDKMKPYLFSCKVPSVDGVVLKPQTVSLVAKPCDPATNLVKVNGEPNRNMSIAKEFDKTVNQSGLWNTAVCAPALYFFHKDFSLRLIEWFEVLKSLGVAKVFLYETDVHPNIEKVLNHYEASGYIQVTKYTYPPPYINDPSLRRVFSRERKPFMWALENVYFTDCVLRHMHEYRFIAHFDPDELPILIKHKSLPKLVDDLLRTHTRGNESPPIYKIHWSLFYDNIPPPSSVANLSANLWALRHVMHHKELYKAGGNAYYKSIYDMDTVATVYSHGFMSRICNGKKCTPGEYKIPDKDAYLGHFKTNCDTTCMEKEFIEETAYTKIRSQVSAAVSEVIKKIGLTLETEDDIRQWTD